MRNRNAICKLAVVLGILVPHTVYAIDIELERAVTDIARDRCRGELVEGKDYKRTVLAEGKVQIRLLGAKYAGLTGTFVSDLETWEGRRPVPKEKQADENKHFRECVRSELHALRSAYKK